MMLLYIDWCEEKLKGVCKLLNKGEKLKDDHSKLEKEAETARQDALLKAVADTVTKPAATNGSFTGFQKTAFPKYNGNMSEYHTFKYKWKIEAHA